MFFRASFLANPVNMKDYEIVEAQVGTDDEKLQMKICPICLSCKLWPHKFEHQKKIQSASRLLRGYCLVKQPEKRFHEKTTFFTIFLPPPPSSRTHMLPAVIKTKSYCVINCLNLSKKYPCHDECCSVLNDSGQSILANFQNVLPATITLGNMIKQEASTKKASIRAQYDISFYHLISSAKIYQINRRGII